MEIRHKSVLNASRPPRMSGTNRTHQAPRKTHGAALKAYLPTYLPPAIWGGAQTTRTKICLGLWRGRRRGASSDRAWQAPRRPAAPIRVRRAMECARKRSLGHSRHVIGGAVGKIPSTRSFDDAVCVFLRIQRAILVWIVAMVNKSLACIPAIPWGGFK